MTAPSQSFRRLAFWTGVATLVLILVGGIVRVSESGLGCGPAGSGLQGWPFCNGDLVPGLELNAIIEYSHRLLGSIVGLMMLALAIWTIRSYRANRNLVKASCAAFVLVVAQGLLGALTVELNLGAGLVAAHLGLAMILLALIAYIWRSSRGDVIGSGAVNGGPNFKAVAGLAQIGLFLTIVAGGFMAGTQKFGRTDFQLGDGAHHACGTEFPACNGAFMPFGQAPLVDIHLTHRFFLYVTTALIVWLVVMALRRRPSPRIVRMAWVALGILVLQLLIGALNVWIAEIYEVLIVAHLLLATLLWGHLFGINLQLYRVPEPRPVRGRMRAAEANA
ncbi:MAG: COX15/CtaA family protein [Thermoleophilaceae bacterium]|nr:COX15/CtaA family protein [Thermoleophilaceae bacterium]